MSGTMTLEKPPTNITEENVIEWLRKNPNFLIERPEVCDFLTPPTEKRERNISDFQSFMIKRLKEDKEGIIEEAREMVETSRLNMNNLSRIHKAVLMMLEAQNFEEFIHVMTMDFSALMDVDIVTITVESEGDVIPHIHMNGVHVVTPGTIDLLMKDKVIILEENIAGCDKLYGGGSGLVKSQALVKLNIGHDVPQALLAFGSRNPEMFQSGQGTEMIFFLGQVVERCFRLWLRLPL
jgi:uncharacterized protein YigA (DUF484 family)